MTSRTTIDPFAPVALGARPAFAAYWPDTRFMELDPASAYFRELPGVERVDALTAGLPAPLLGAAISILHHERLHWQIRYGRSWGQLRAALATLRTLLGAELVLRLDVGERTRLAASRRSGRAVLHRSDGIELAIEPSWSPTTHSLAEHAWGCSVLSHLLDTGDARFARARPPEFLLGVTAQYLAAGLGVRQVIDMPDALFEARVRSFKRTLPWAESVAMHDGGDAWASATAIEECLAIVSQLNHLRATARGREGADARLLERFRTDLVSGLYAATDDTYRRAFELAERYLPGAADARSDLLGVIADLALDPPLPFADDGTADRSSWAEFHPSLRFARLLRCAASVTGHRVWRLDGCDAGDVHALRARLLDASALAAAEPVALARWQRRIAAVQQADEGRWATAEGAIEDAAVGAAAVHCLDAQPGALVESRHAPTDAEDDDALAAFLDFPPVLFGGTYLDAPESGERVVRMSAAHAACGYLTRFTDHALFGLGEPLARGLPRAASGALSTSLRERALAYLESRWQVRFID